MPDAIARLRGLVEKATKGPWVVRDGLKATAGGIMTVQDIFGPGGEWVLCNITDADRALIVAAVNALPTVQDIFGPGGERVLCNITDADRALIVAAVNALPALLAVAEEMKVMDNAYGASNMKKFWRAWDKARTALANLETHT